MKDSTPQCKCGHDKATHNKELSGVTAHALMCSACVCLGFRQMPAEPKGGEVSITGIRYNDPSVCVKGTNFACICPACQARWKAMRPIIDKIFEEVAPAEPPHPESFTSPEIEKAIDEIISATPGAPVPPTRPEKDEKDCSCHCHEVCPCHAATRIFTHCSDCPTPPHKEEDWAGQLAELIDKEAYACSKGKDCYANDIIEFVRIKKSDWEARARDNHPNCYADKAEVEFKIAEARAEGCERGKAEAKQFLDEMVIKLAEARAEAVREERERVRKAVDKYFHGLSFMPDQEVSRLGILALLEPKADTSCDGNGYAECGNNNCKTCWG